MESGGALSLHMVQSDRADENDAQGVKAPIALQQAGNGASASHFSLLGQSLGQYGASQHENAPGVRNFAFHAFGGGDYDSSNRQLASMTSIFQQGNNPTAFQQPSQGPSSGPLIPQSFSTGVVQHENAASSPQALMNALNLLQQNIGALQALVPLISSSYPPGSGSQSQHLQQQQAAASAGVASVISQLAVAAAGILPHTEVLQVSGAAPFLQQQQQQQQQQHLRHLNSPGVLPQLQSQQVSAPSDQYKLPAQGQQDQSEGGGLLGNRQGGPGVGTAGGSNASMMNLFGSQGAAAGVGQGMRSEGLGLAYQENDGEDDKDDEEERVNHKKDALPGFKRDANLRMHMRGHGDEYKTAAALMRPDKQSQDLTLMRPRRFSCPYVGCKRNKKHRKFQPLKTMLCVKNHYRRSHCPKMLTCSKCGSKKFSVVADLKTHEKHCGRDKWMCSCRTTFSRKDKLLGHLSLFAGHTPAMPLHVMEECINNSSGSQSARNSFLANEGSSPNHQLTAGAEDQEQERETQDHETERSGDGGGFDQPLGVCTSPNSNQMGAGARNLLSGSNFLQGLFTSNFLDTSAMLR